MVSTFFHSIFHSSCMIHVGRQQNIVNSQLTRSRPQYEALLAWESCERVAEMSDVCESEIIYIVSFGGTESASEYLRIAELNSGELRRSFVIWFKNWMWILLSTPFPDVWKREQSFPATRQICEICFFRASETTTHLSRTQRKIIIFPILSVTNEWLRHDAIFPHPWIFPFGLWHRHFRKENERY